MDPELIQDMEPEQPMRLPLRRCIRCFYVLEGLPEARCPECGLEFNLDDPTTYTTRPPFVRWKYWLPGFLLALGVGLVLYVFLFSWSGVGVALTLVLPFCLGAIIAYGCRVGYLMKWVLALIVIAMLATVLVSGQIEGLFCGVVLAVLAILPAMLGVLMGILLRMRLKHHGKFTQREYLPLIGLILLPAVWGTVERWTPHRRPVVVVVTTTVMNARLERAWEAVMFYEEVKHAPPLLLRIGPRPIYTCGSTAAVGDVKVCVYTEGRLTKRVTKREPGKVLAFDVIEQKNIENCTTRLIDGSFAFERVSDSETKVILTTRYEALIRPRWYWEPVERLVAHTLHGHVLLGMRMKAEEGGRLVVEGQEASTRLGVD